MEEKKMKLASAMLVASAYAFAGVGNKENDAYYPQPTYVWSLKEDGSTVSSWLSNASGQWGEDSSHPNNDNDYYVPAAWRRIAAAVASSADAAMPFAGRSLTVACELHNPAAYAQWINLGDNVTLLGGAVFSWSSIGNVTGSRLSIERSNDQWPVYLRWMPRDDGIKTTTFAVPLEGDAEQRVDWMGYKYDPNSAKCYAGRFNLASAWPDFHGKVVVSNNNELQAAMFSSPGRFEFHDAKLILTGVDGASSLGSLKLTSSANLLFSGANNSHVLEIADRLELEPGAAILGGKFTDWKVPEPSQYPMFRLSPQAVEAGVPDMSGVRHELGDSIQAVCNLPRVEWYVSELADGGAEIGISRKGVVTIAKGTDYNNTPFRNGQSAADFLSDGSDWHGGVDYIDNAHNLIMRETRYDFRGDSLTLRASAVGLYGDFTCGELSFTRGVRTRLMRESAVLKIGGGLSLHDDVDVPAAKLNVGNRSTLRIESNLSGGGRASAELSPEATGNIANWCGALELAGDNAAWTGTLSLDAGAEGDFRAYFEDKGHPAYRPSSVSNVTLVAHGPTSLGGALETLNPSAILVGNECRLSFAETATFEAANRGIAFAGKGYLRVEEGVVATIRQPLTFADGAHVVKEGGGRLDLGVAPALPEGGSATLRVDSGDVGVLAPKAFASIDVAIGASSRVVVTAGGEGVDLTVARSLTVGGSGGRLKMSIDFSGEEVFPQERSVRLLKFGLGQSALIGAVGAPMVKVVGSPVHYTVYKISQMEDDSGNSVVMARLMRHPPFVLSVR